MRVFISGSFSRPWAEFELLNAPREFGDGPSHPPTGSFEREDVARDREGKRLHGTFRQFDSLQKSIRQLSFAKQKRPFVELSESKAK